MAAKKTPAKKAEPVEVLSDKEIVLKKYPDADKMQVKDGFVIIDPDSEKTLHSGLAKSESGAWKKAARECL